MVRKRFTDASCQWFVSGTQKIVCKGQADASCQRLVSEMSGGQCLVPS